MRTIFVLRQWSLPLALTLLAGCGGSSSSTGPTAPKQVSVPSVTGETQAAATTALTTVGLVVGTAINQSSSTVPSGDVVSENPAAGTQVNAGSAINLIVSSGPVQVAVAVPNVMGETQAVATAAITSAGLVLGTVTTQTSSTTPSGTVISQSPAAGTQVNTGSAVNLVVSLGPGQVAVPNIVGQAQAAATAAITGAGLVLGTVTTQSSSTVPSGIVISQSPAAGKQVNVGSTVNFVVSSGAGQVPVPDVLGETQAAATTSITTAGLVLGTVTIQSSSTVPSGSVIGQSPAPATQVNVGSAVNLIVSSGAAKVAVPNMVGDTQAAATTALTTAGLVLGTVTTQPSGIVASGSVISQSPAAATQVNAGSAVNLVVSSGAGQVAVPNVVGETQAAATTSITSAGLVLGTVTNQSSSTVPSGSVISENPGAGTEVNAGSAVNLVISSGPVPLSAANLNLIFVVSGDLAYQAPGDVNPQTANLTDQGLNRSLLMAPYLQQNVLGSANVTSIYALEPMTHLQTTSNYPDMAALETIQQFALLNHITLSSTPNGGTPVPGNSFPLNASYAPAPVTPPSGVATPLIACPSCQGIDFNDQAGDNETLVNNVVSANVPGFYVFSAPWETISALLININNNYSYGLAIPAGYAGPDYIYAISIAPSGSASLLTYNGNLNPPTTYPTPSSPPALGNACTATPFNIAVTGGVGGAVIPAGVNTNETLYIIRHAEAHPAANWDDGNYICAGQWRALELPNALHGKISPQQVYASDPAQVFPGSVSASGESNWSYVRPALTVEPYAVANNLPYKLAASFDFQAQNPPQLATQASNFFFAGGEFSTHTVLLAWEHAHIPTTVSALLASYYPNGGAPTAPDWPEGDYDTIWTVTLDANGNVNVNNNMCEGIVSASLPATCPEF
jgi:beta-lactam-binding protein with PASTA domain